MPKSASIQVTLFFVATFGASIALAKEPDPVLERPNAEAAEIAKLRKQMASAVWQERSRAIERAGQLGPLGKPLLEELCEATLERNPQLRQAALKAIDAIDPVFFSVVEDVILDANEQVRIDAIRRLEALKSDARPSLPILMARFRSGRDGESSHCLRAMHVIAPKDERIVRLIVDLAEKSPSRVNRSYAMQSLASLPREPKQTAKIIKMLDNTARSNADFRRTAMRELGRFGVAAKTAIPTLDSIRLTSKSSEERDLAKEVIASIEKAVQNEIKNAAPENEPEKDPIKAAVVGAAIPVDSPKLTDVFLCDLPEKSVQVWHYLNIKEFGFSKNGKLWDDGRWHDLSLAGKASPKGIETHPPSKGAASVVYDVQKLGKNVFRSRVGIADLRRADPASPVTFEVIGDGQQLWASKPVAKWGQAQECEVKISGVKILELRVRCPGDAAFARAVWCEGRLCDD